MTEVRAIHLPQAEERKRLFLQLNQIEDVRFIFEEGVDGKCLDLPELKRTNIIVGGTQGMTFGLLGSGLAHRNLWLKSIELGQCLIVCEDDAVFRKDFHKQFTACMRFIPSDWDFLLLGYNFDSVLEVDMITGVEHFAGEFYNRKLGPLELQQFQQMCTPATVLPLRNAFGLPGYAVSPAGAKFLLNNVFPIQNRPIRVPALRRTILTGSVDTTMNALYRQMKAYACIPPLVVTPNEKDPADQDAKVN